jgi:hypothetical protein
MLSADTSGFLPLSYKCVHDMYACSGSTYVHVCTYMRTCTTHVVGNLQFFPITSICLQLFDFVYNF